MKVPHAVSSSEGISDGDELQSFRISELFPSNIATTDEGFPAINSPFSVLVALLSGTARVLPKGVIIQRGQVALVPPACPCTFSPDDASQVELAAVDFNFKANGMDITAALPEVPIIIPGDHGEQLAADVCTICNSAGNTTGLGRTTARLKAGYSIAHTLSQVLGWDSLPQLFHHEDGELQALTSYLGDNYHLPLTVEDIAAACKVSRRKLFKVAARHRSGTPMRLLKQIRMEQSLAYLRRDELSIGQIAVKVGFLDAGNFSREFKKHYGQSPQQYRQQSALNVHTESLVLKADLNLRMNLAKRASVLYRQAIDGSPQNTDLNKLHYQAGVALKRAGDGQGAADEWSKVTTLYYRLLIGLEECNDYNKATHYQEIADRLRRAFDYGDNELRTNVIDRLGDYMLQCASTGNQVATKHYTRLACELSPGNQILQPKLARTLYLTGQFQEVERWCPGQHFQVAGALRAMGRYTEHLERFPEMRQQNALILLRQGEVDTVLAEYDDLPEICVHALCDSGRMEEAVTRYPDHNARALLILGRNDEILECHPEDDQMCAFALANMGRVEEALVIAARHPELMARLLLHLERPQEVTLAAREYNVSITRAANVLMAIHRLEKGDHRYALEILEAVLPVTDPDHRVDHEFYQSDVIIPLVKFLVRDVVENPAHSRWPSWPNQFSRIVQDYRYCYEQRLWYDVRFILGEADDDDYRAQPYQRHVETRLCLTKGIKAELLSDGATAASRYQRYMETRSPFSQVFCTSGVEPVLKAFVRWRLSELEG